MFTFAIELANQKRKDGKQAIQMRITRDRKHKRVSVGIFINQSEYTGLKGDWVKNQPEINQELLDLLEGASRFVDERRKKLKNVTADHIVYWVKHKEEIDFIAFAEREVEAYNKKSQYRTYLRYKNVIEKLKDYQYDEPIFFSDITVRFVKSYRLYLESLENSEKTIFNDLACLRVLINKAVEKEVISPYDNPFVALKIKPPAPKKANYFTKDELSQFERVTPNSDRQKLAHDVFLFALYMGGLRFGEIVALKWRSIVNGQLSIHNGTLNIHEKANAILKNYRSKTWSTNDYVFPFVNPDKEPETEEKLKKIISSKNALINKSLKEMWSQVESEKTISFYTARHTFAHLATSTSKDLKSLSVVLGHTSEGQTKLYLETIKKSDEDNLLNSIFYE